MSPMPGTVRSVRAMLFVVGALNIGAAGWFTVAAATFETGALGLPVVVLLLLAALLLGTLAVAAVVIAVKFTNGGNGARAGAVAVGYLIAVGCAVGVMTHRGVWGVGVAAGALMIVLSAGPDSRAWFDRDRTRRP
ncbi:hypothetical protein ACFWM0_10040 [Streptomyces sp. NPDC058405]|uniref:hypothetical protein n=1 Tax=unclassified Streptomyces TaxID=2593676 RepID=UPI00365153CB